MKVDEIRGPVKTQFGYHIIKLDGIKESTTKTFEQSRSDIEAEYRRNEAERLFNNLQDQLADAALQNATDIDVVARKAGLKVQEIPGFSRSEGGGALGKAPKVLEAAFSADVLDGHLSPIVEVEKGRGVVLHASDHKLPQQKPLEAVRAEIVAAWKKQRGIELALSNAQAAAKRLEGGESWESVAKSLNGTVQAPRFVGRSDAAVPPDIRQAAFEAPKPAGKPMYEAIALAGGDAAVFGLSGVREDPTGDKQQLDFDLRRQYAQRQAAAEGQSYALASRADAKVSLNPQAID
jgi:peptidyl-prolyl cis-trans isomerase D